VKNIGTGYHGGGAGSTAGKKREVKVQSAYPLVVPIKFRVAQGTPAERGPDSKFNGRLIGATVGRRYEARQHVLRTRRAAD
jgi:hypothetical protein